MPRNRLIYNVQDVFVGPSEAASNILVHHAHILQRLERVYGFNYSINIPETNIESLGSQGSVVRTTLQGPDVSFDISYYANGVNNEVRAGFTPLYHVKSGDADPIIANQTIGSDYSNFFSGFYDNGIKGDRRNFYLIVNSGQDDLRYDEDIGAAFQASGGTRELYSERASGLTTICFVNSYLTSYRTAASIGNLPTVTLSYVADEVIGFVSGSGIGVPTVTPNQKVPVGSEYRFVIPKYSGDFNTNVCKVVTPGDITINLSGNYGLTNLILSLQDVKIQGYNINIDIPRAAISFLGNYRPSSREILLPIRCQVGLNILVGDMTSGSILNQLDIDNEYYITLYLKNSKISNSFSNVLRYDFRKAKLQSAVFSNSIGSNAAADLTFVSEVVASGLDAGLFVSGIINHRSDQTVPVIWTALMGEGTHAGQVLVREDGVELWIDPIVYTPNVF